VTKYQRRPSRKTLTGLQVIVGQPVRAGETLALQKYRYESALFVREPDYHAGANVDMDEMTYTLTARVDGVVTLRRSAINPDFKWLDVDPDIQKVHRTQQMRRHYVARSEASPLHPAFNPAFAEEWKELQEPAWRTRVIRKMPDTERFPDPNLLARGLATSIAPKPQYFFE
jgi:hypothetical protein